MHEFIPWWNGTLTVAPSSDCDAHRRLGKEHDLAAILSHVEQRQISNGYTVSYGGQRYQMERGEVRARMRGAKLRVESRLDGSVAMRFEDRYVSVTRIDPPTPANARQSVAPRNPKPPTLGRSRWMEGFWKQPAPTLRRAIAIANATS